MGNSFTESNSRRITGDLTSHTQTHYKLTKGTRYKIRGGGGFLFANLNIEVKRKKLKQRRIGIKYLIYTFFVK